MKNRVSALVVALVMMLSLFSVGAMAWGTGEGVDVYWNDEKVGTVTYDTMEDHIKDYGDEVYSNNKGEYTGKVYYFSKLLKTVNKSDEWKTVSEDTTVEIADATASKPAKLTKKELDESRYYFDKDGKASAEPVKPGFMHETGETFFRFVYGQKDKDDSTSGNFAKLNTAGNATVKINTPTTPDPADDEEQTTGFEVYWNDKKVGTVSYKDMVVDGVSQATKTVTYSTRNKKNTYEEETGYLYKFTQLLEAVKKDADWEAASDLTTVVFETDKPAEFTKKELTEERYYWSEDGKTQIDTVKPGFLTDAKDGKNGFKFAFGQKTADEVNKNRFSSFDAKALTKVRINTPILDVIDADGKKTELLYSDLVDLWNAEGTDGVGKKYNYSNINTYPTFKVDEYYGPTLKAVLAKAGINLDELADTDVIRFDSSDGKGADVTVKDIKETRYNFPNGESKNGNKGTTDAQKKDSVEVPYILSVKNGATNLRNVFGQVDPQEQNLSYFIKYINKISVKKDAAKEFTGMTPTIANNSKVKKGDKLNFDLTLPTGVYEGAIYYTVSTDGTEPANPTYSDIFYNFAQNRTDGKDYEDPAKAKLYNMYEFTDAEKTIIKATVYVSGYKPTTTTLTYTKAEESKFTGLANEADKDGNWWYYTDGKIDTNHTGVDQNKYGWWRVENGKVNFKAQGIYQNKYGWWKTTDGKVTFKEVGVFQNKYGWWRVKDSKVDFNAQSIYQNKYGWWKTTNGKVTFKENGVFQNEYGWWKVKDSKVDFKFNGAASNQYGTWYIKNGKVDFGFNGTYNGNQFKNGKLVGKANANTTKASTNNKPFVADTSTDIVHDVNCKTAKSIKSSNRVYFSTLQEAIAKGYTVADDCFGK